MFHVQFSNRHETLLGLLLDRLVEQREDVFLSDQVVVPSAAMRRALTLAIADQEGVCANVGFVFLARWLWQQVARVVPGVQDQSPFDADALTWRVYAAFGDQDFVAAHPRLFAYLRAAGDDEVMRYELAARTAGLLEQYVTYRDDWLAQWQAGRDAKIHARHGADEDAVRADEAWQAALWQRIASELGLQVAHPFSSLIEALQGGGAELARSAGLPEAVHVFALSSMPPLHLRALQQLARWMDVHLYVLNPCREFWFDLVDPAQLSQLEVGGDDQGFEVGHSLLASWGKQTQSHLGLLMGVCDGEGADSADHYVDIDEASLLARVHRSLLDLQEIAPGSVELADNDRSIEIHVCHSLTRELEVLHDHLLGLFAADPQLRASDILVVAPDLESAAPLIDAVFGTAPAQRKIPFAITGRARSKVNAPVRAFLELLGLASSRCPATAVFGLLQQPIVARRFGLDDDGLQRIHDWMLAAGIHWGLDAQHVASLDLPGHAAHTLAGGLDRLYLGYAAPGDLQEPFGDLLPSGDAEGSAALALGAFWRLVDGLQNLRVDLSQARSPEAWAGFLHEVADRFISPDDSEVEDHVELHAAFDELTQTMLRGGLDAPVAAPIVRAALKRAFDESAMGGVPTGRITFTGMSSLRNVPFKVICAVGLNDGAFPTADQASEFDLMAQAPRLGDRQRRTDQRTLFLDLMLAARQSLYFSYTGRSIRDNASLPPSVLVSELLDVIVPAVADEQASQAALDRARQRLVVEHPLQPFSPEAFSADGDERLRSFDAELAQALRSSLQIPEAKPSPQPEIRDESSVDIDDGASVDEEENAADSRPFFTAPLAEPGPEWREVPVNRLVQFFRNPSRYLLRSRLQLDLPREEETLDDDEPFLPDLPGRSALAARLLPVLLRGADIEAVRRLAQCGGELPMGALGAADLERELSALTQFAQVVREASREPVMAPHLAAAEFMIDGDSWRVTGGFADLRPSGLVRWRYDDERASDVLDAWIHHLVLCADPPKELTQPVTTWLARRDQRALPALERAVAREHLGELLQLYRRGLREPLPFFPKSAWILLNSGEHRARAKWEGSPDFAGESQDPAYRLAFRGLGDPLGGDFEELANTVFGPISGAGVSTTDEQAEA